MGQTFYVLLLIVIAVVMTAGLTAIAFAFDTYVIKSGSAFANLRPAEATSDLADGSMLESLVTEIQRLI